MSWISVPIVAAALAAFSLLWWLYSLEQRLTTLESTLVPKRATLHRVAEAACRAAKPRGGPCPMMVQHCDTGAGFLVHFDRLQERDPAAAPPAVCDGAIPVPVEDDTTQKLSAGDQQALCLAASVPS